jgi:adenylate cyclase
LVDGRDGSVVWTERQDVAAPDIYTSRAAIVQRIAGSLRSNMRMNEEALAQHRPPASMDVYAMTMRAITLKHKFAPKEMIEARSLLERVVQMDPQYAPGWVYLGMVNLVDFASALTGPRRPEMINAAIEQSEKAITLDHNLAWAYITLNNSYMFVGRHAESIRAGERCMELAPSDADCMAFLAATLVSVNQAEKALTLARKAIALNPLPPPWVQNF